MSARVLCAVGAIALIAGCAKSSEEARVLSPEFAASRGYDAYNAGNLPRAEAYFEIALEADPDNPYARVGLDEVRAAFRDRSRATQVVQATRKTIADTPDRVAGVTRERVEPLAVAPPVLAPPVTESPVVAQVVEAVAETPPVAPPAPYSVTIDVETAPVMMPGSDPLAALSPELSGEVESAEAYRTVGSYETYLASLDPVAEPVYIATASLDGNGTAPVSASVSASVENADYIAQAPLDPVPVPVVETVAVIPDPAPLAYTTVATAYPVQDVLQYGQPLNFADTGADGVVQAVAAPISDGGQGVTVAASGPAGGAVVYAPVLDGIASSGAQSLRPEAWIPLSSVTESFLIPE